MFIKNINIKRIFNCFVLSNFIFLQVCGVAPQKVLAQSALNFPEPGTMVTMSQPFVPPMLTGLVIHPENPFQFDFVVDSGNEKLNEDELKSVSNKLIRYFLASLAIPENELWVNLSPYEKDRIIPDAFGKTEMGRDLLAQDYMLKQLIASLMYPETALGSEFWNKVYKQAQEKFGTTEIPVNTFNKVWIIPERTEIFENKDRVFVVSSHLKVLLEKDYLAKESSLKLNKPKSSKSVEQEISSSIIREIIIPAIEKEVNKGKNFAQLRQIYNSFILAAWYKKNLKQSILNQVYSDKEKIEGIELEDIDVKNKIYDRYLAAFKSGVFDFIKEDYDEKTQEIVPRRYFSGGAVVRDVSSPVKKTPKAVGDLAMISVDLDTPDGEIGKKFNYDKGSQKNVLLNDEGWVDGYMPLSSFVKVFNRMYYEVNGHKITKTLETNTSVSHDSKTANANAIEFFRYLQDLDQQGNLPEEITVQSWGVGSGQFDADFLKKFIDLDRKNGTFYRWRMKYVLVDNSKSVLARALHSIAPYDNEIRIETLLRDLSVPLFGGKGGVQYIRFNELYDDLPSERIKMNADGRFYRRGVRPSFKIDEEIQLTDGTILSKKQFIQKYFEREESDGLDLIPENVVSKIHIGSWNWEEIDISSFPYGNIVKSWFEDSGLSEAIVNTGALANLVASLQLLDKGSKGYIQFYDYGSNTAGFAGFRFNYDWGQPTFDVDFNFLDYAIKKMLTGIEVRIENQNQYLTEVLSQKVFPRRYIVTTDRDEMAASVSEELIPDLEIPKQTLFHKFIFGESPMPIFSKTKIAEELRQLWQKAKNRGSLWITEEQICSLPSVRDLPDSFKGELVSNLFAPNRSKRKFGSNLRNNLFHMRVRMSSGDAAGKKNKGGIDFNPAHLDIQSHGQKVDLPLLSNIDTIENLEVNGLVPFIFKITPVNNLPDLLGKIAEERPGNIARN